MPPAFDLPAEYARLGVPVSDAQQTGSGSTDWRLETTLNADYTLCSTYPRCLAVPASASLDLMREVAAFRTRGRLPVLCWRRDGSGALLRGSQPGAGVLGRRSTADEHWFRMLGAGSKEPLALLDCRPLIAAMANRFKGGGTESRSLYGYSTYEHLGIANVHAVKSAAKQAYGGDTAAWLKLQSVLLHAAARAAELLSRGANVLLHCSDGWDRTPQVSCLAQLLLDGHYRTRRGFALLVEKEWLAFGHKFAERRRLGMPIFVQFLDAVEQLRAQNADHFEFNEFFLLALAAAHDGARGPDGLGLPRPPFEADCEAERAQASARGCGGGVSAWDPLLSRDTYANPRYHAHRTSAAALVTTAAAPAAEAAASADVTTAAAAAAVPSFTSALSGVTESPAGTPRIAPASPATTTAAPATAAPATAAPAPATASATAAAAAGASPGDATPEPAGALPASLTLDPRVAALRHRVRPKPQAAEETARSGSEGEAGSPGGGEGQRLRSLTTTAPGLFADLLSLGGSGGGGGLFSASGALNLFGGRAQGGSRASSASSGVRSSGVASAPAATSAPGTSEVACGAQRSSLGPTRTSMRASVGSLREDSVSDYPARATASRVSIGEAPEI